MTVAPFLSHPLIIPAFLAGILLSGALAAWNRSLRLRGRLCPHCASTTVALLPRFPLRLLMRNLVKRWCPGCGWKGLASQPAHERRGRSGKIRLRRGFRWGAPLPPPKGFFNWSGQEAGGRSETQSPAGNPDPEGPELPLPGFQWRDDYANPGGTGFNWAGELPPPANPFQFAQEEEGDASAAGRKPPPPIPFRFADDPEPVRQEGEVPPSSRGILSRLRFRWKG